MDEQEANVYGYEIAQKPDSALHDGCIEMVVATVWIKQTTKRGDNEEVRSVTYRTPWGKETAVAVPYQANYTVPDNMITLENLEYAIKELLRMKGK